MLGLKEESPFAMLRQFAVYLGADLEDNIYAAKLLLDNDTGHGAINLYEPFRGLTAWVYNIEFSSDFSIDLKFTEKGPYYFGYPVKGYLLQKFPGEKKHMKIRQGQNFIMISESGTRSEFVIPAKKKFKCCFLIVDFELLKKSSVQMRKGLADNLEEILRNAGSDRPYRYFGDIDLKTGSFAETIVNNRRTDVVGRLLTEGAISSMLATQMEAYDLGRKSGISAGDLSGLELSKISRIGDYVKDNIKTKVNLPDLCKALAISPKKLQLGVRLLYGSTVAGYVQNFRLETSKELIHKTDLKISEISKEVGITSQSYFPKIFKERYGILPNEYKASFSSPDVIYEISYRSVARKNLTEDAVGEMIQMARKKNNQFGISGCLIFHEEVFFQIMEGPKRNVLQLYENIKADDRHFDVLTIHQGAKVYRDFKQWDMALFSENNILNLTYEGNTAELDLDHLMKDNDRQTLLSKNLWRKVLLRLKAV